MEAHDERRIMERREAARHGGEGRRIDKERRSWGRRHSAGEGMTDGGKFDRRGAHPSLFATLGLPPLRGVRSPQRSGVVRRSFVRRSFARRCVDR